MNQHKPAQRILAMALSVVMVLGMTPISAAAEILPIGASGEIIAFEALSEETINREVVLGTSLEDLDLPETLMATMRVATETDAEEPVQDEPVQDSGEPQQQEEPEVPAAEGEGELVQDSGEPATPPEADETEPQERTVSVPVTWDSEPDYDGSTAGTYLFTAQLEEGYALSAELPQITVTVREEEAPPETGGEITAFDPLDEEIAEQSHPVGTPLSELTLPKTLAATVDGAAVSVPVTWDAEPEYNPNSEGEEPGDYLFIPQLGEGYTLAEGVSIPQITVTTQAPAVGLALRNAGAPIDITGLADVTAIKEAIETALGAEGVTSVTVIGNKTEVDQTLNLAIPDGKTVVWAATFEGDSSFSWNLISLSGDGTFEVTTGGAVSTSGNSAVAISATGTSSTVTVSGGTVSATTGTAIFIIGENSRVTVSGGLVTGAGTSIGNPIIYAGTPSNPTTVNVTVSGNGVVRHTSILEDSSAAIRTGGSVEIKGNAEVSAITGYAIYTTGASSTVTVSGGTVSATGNSGYAIYAEGASSEVTVSGSGKVEATAANGRAIYTTGTNATVTVSGGSVMGAGAGSTSISVFPVIDMQGTPSDSETVNVTVGGTGSVEATGKYGCAISTQSSVVVKDEAEVSATGNYGYAIYAHGASSEVTVSGTAEVSVTGIYGYAIYAEGASSEVTVSGGTVSATAAGGRAIYTTGTNATVTVSGGTVSATGNSGYAIYAEGASSEVTVSGEGKVKATAAGTAIYIYTTGTNATVTVSGEGKVEATAADRKAIYTAGKNATVTVSGGTVSSTGENGRAIYTVGESPEVTVSGGTVSATAAGGIAIYTTGTNATVAVSGTGKVQATAAGGYAIETYGNVEVKDSAEVTATTGHAITTRGESSTATISGSLAIHAIGAGSTVTVSGGVVFAPSSDVTGASGVVYLPNNSGGFTGANGTGVVIAWTSSANNRTYSMRGTLDIQSSPAHAAYWYNNNEGTGGIAYKNGANEGFIPLAGVTVTKITLEEPNLTYTNPSTLNHTYNGSAQGIGAVTHSGTGTATAETGGIVTVKYNGSATAPTNAGTYAVTAEISGGAEYEAASIPLGDYTIGKKQITITPEPDQSKIYGQPDPGLDYTPTPALFSGDSFTGALARAEGSNVGTYAITQGTLSAGSNYTLNFTPGVMFAINKGDYSGDSITTTKNVLTNLVQTGVEVDMSGLISNISGASVSGAAEGSNSENIIDNISYTGDKVKFDVNSIAQADKTAIINVTISSTNYKDLTATITVKTVDKAEAGVSFSGTVPSAKTYGEGTFILTTSATAPGQNGIWTWESSDPAVLRVTGNSASVSVEILKSGSAAITAKYESDTTLGEVSTATITVGKASLKVQPKSFSIYTGGAIPTLEVLYSGLKNSDTSDIIILAGGTLEMGIRKADGSALANTNTIGTYDIVFTGSPIFAESEKYDISIDKGTFTISNKPYDGGGGGGGSSTPSTPTVITTEKKPNQPTTAEAPVTATAGKNGAASASISEKSITDAIAKAQADAKAQGKTAHGIAVELNITMPKGATSLTATLTRRSLNSLVSAGVTSLTINGSLVTVSFDKKALSEIQKQSTGNIQIKIAPNASLSAAAKKMIGSRPVYDITVGYGSGKTVTSFGGGIATVSIPYTLAKGEAIGGLYAVYVDAKGNAQRIAGSAYDASSGCVMFTTTHFSLYGIGYTAPSAKFTDIQTHWVKEAIDYVVGRGLLSGTSETTFAPDTAMTRAMLVTALGRLAGVDVKAYATNSFTDVKSDSTFRPYIEWAYKKGIVQGLGNQQFAPDRAITREEIAVIFANFAKATGYKLPVTRTATTYADASSIGSAYKAAVTTMQQAGIMMGGTGGKFNPKASATRAEVSSMLHRYIKLTIDPSTAQGWAKNDAGQYLYYKNGKALTGTQTIDGVKYFFETTGVLKTGWVKDGDNWRFYSGNIMLVGFWNLGANGESGTYYFTKDGFMVAGKWLQINGKWYYFYADGKLAKNANIDGYEVDANGVRKTK